MCGWGGGGGGGGGGLEEFIFTCMMRIIKGFLWVQNNDFEMR